MAEKKFIEDKERLLKLAPVASAPIKHQVLVCNGKSCLAVGAADVKAEFERILAEKDTRFGKPSKGRNPEGPILLTDCGSMGFCSVGPAVLIYPDGTWYAQVQPKDVGEIIEEHLENGSIVERLKLAELIDK